MNTHQVCHPCSWKNRFWKLVCEANRSYATVQTFESSVASARRQSPDQDPEPRRRGAADAMMRLCLRDLRRPPRAVCMDTRIATATWKDVVLLRITLCSFTVIAERDGSTTLAIFPHLEPAPWNQRCYSTQSRQYKSTIHSEADAPVASRVVSSPNFHSSLTIPTHAIDLVLHS